MKMKERRHAGSRVCAVLVLVISRAGPRQAATLGPDFRCVEARAFSGDVDYMPGTTENRRVPPRESGPVAQLGARFHGMEEVIGSIPIRSTKQPLQNQAYAGSGSLPPFHDFVSFCVTRAEGLRRLLTTAPVSSSGFAC